MTHLRIEELNPEEKAEDLERLAPAFLRIWNEPQNLRYLSFTGLPFAEKQAREWLGRCRTAGVRYFCAIESDGAITGVLAVRANPVEGFELMGLGVAGARQHAGIGKQLVRHGVEVARGEGYRAVEGQVYATNAPMLRLLLGLGFVPVRMEHHRGPAGEDLVQLKCYL